MGEFPTPRLAWRAPPLPRLLAAATPAGDAATDAELLRRFVREADGPAFELVVRRHAPAVWAACRRILPEADAEDAFQAAFLVLARKAGAVRGASAGGWLHRVAVTAALKRKAAGHRHPVADEAPAQAADPSPSPPDAATREELAAAVHEELARLPDRYRLPVVLCDLEGETQPAAAARLGWPVGSVAGRLSRARALLRDRLTRRGFAPAGSVLVLPLVAVPGRVVTAAVAAATGAAPPAAPVSLLVTGVLSAMRTAKLKVVGVALVSAGLVVSAGFGAYAAVAQPVPTPQGPPAAKADPPADPGGGGEWLADSLRGKVPSAFPDVVPPKLGGDFVAGFPTLLGRGSLRIEPADGTYQRLLKAKIEQYRQHVTRLQLRMEVGQFQSAEYYGLTQISEEVRATVAELWRNDPRVLDAWLVDLVRLAKSIELYAGARVRAGTDPPQQLNAAVAHRLSMEAALWKHRNPGRAP